MIEKAYQFTDTNDFIMEKIIDDEHPDFPLFVTRSTRGFQYLVMKESRVEAL